MPPNNSLAGRLSADAPPAIVATSPAAMVRPFARAFNLPRIIIVMLSSAASRIARPVRVICHHNTLEQDFGESVFSKARSYTSVRMACFLPWFGLLFWQSIKNEG